MTIRSIVIVIMILWLTAGLTSCSDESDQPAALPATTNVPANPPAASQPAASQPTTQPATQPTTQPAEAAVDDGQAESSDEGTVPDRHMTLPSLRVSDFTKIEDRIEFFMDFDFQNQDGKLVNLGDFLGKPIAISFIYTRCPMPEMCPLITATMASLQRKVEESGLGGQVNLLLASYDPNYDTPSRLKKFGEDRGMKFNENVMMLRPNPREVPELFSELAVGVKYHQDGSIGHFIEMILIDNQGRFVRDFQGKVWPNEQALADLKILAAEPLPEPEPETIEPSK